MYFPTRKLIVVILILEKKSRLRRNSALQAEKKTGPPLDRSTPHFLKKPSPPWTGNRGWTGPPSTLIAGDPFAPQATGNVGSVFLT